MSDQVRETTGYDAVAAQEKWSKYWEEHRAFASLDDGSRERRYVLDMFAYPSGDLHMGHAEAFAIGDVLLDLAAEQPQQADALIPMMEQAWRRCLEIGERPDQSGAVQGRGSHLAAHNLALLLEACGQGEEAGALRQAYPAPV